MIRIVRQREIDELLSRLAARSVALDAELLKQVSEIIDEVRRRGDAALIDFTRRFDGVELSATELRVSEDALRRSAAHVEPQTLAALRLAESTEREVEAAMRDFIRHALEREARSLAFLDEVRHEPAIGSAAPRS